MPATSLSVQMLTMTPDAEALIYATYRQCYSNGEAAELFREARSDYMTSCGKNKIDEFITRNIASGHVSALESVSFSFAVTGFSRISSQQITRHRHVSPAQQSQRYVNAEDFDFIVPPSIENCDDAFVQSEFEAFMNQAAMMYAHLVEYGIPKEDARFVLPNSCETRFVLSMNARAMMEFLELRLCNRAQWEARALAKAIVAIGRDKLPVVFSAAGPKCKRLGRCPEAQPCRQHVEQMAKEGGAA